MSEKASIDVFKLCWDVIVDESFLFDGTFFNSEHCKINDSTDTNFDMLENRQAYAYKYGCYNVLFFEKCFLNFLNECKEFDTIFPLKKLKVCSLSNGPGFDVVGLLCALCISNKPLKSVPRISAVNLYYSWYTFYETLIYKACSSISLKFTNCIHMKRENISLIQGDIFSKTLSPEVKKCISSSNVLLMVKVFFCSKTTLNTFTKSLKNVFLLLKPGALIFFIGSDNNMIHFSRRRFLSNYVQNIYGPQKVTLDKVMINENYSNVVGQKPVDSGSAVFVVWQKRSQTEIEELIKESQVKGKKREEREISKRPRRKRKTLKEKTEADGDKKTVTNEDNYSSDSELSYTSGSRLSDVSTDVSMNSKINSVPPNLSQGSSIQSIENTTSVLDKADLEYVKEDRSKTDCCQEIFKICNDNAFDFKNETPGVACGNILYDGMSVVNETSSLSYATQTQEGCVLDLMKKENTQILDNASSLNCASDEGALNSMKQTSTQILDNGVSVVSDNSSLSYATQEGWFLDLMKQENTQILDSASSCASDKGALNSMKQADTQVLDNSVSVVRDTSCLSSANDKDYSGRDLMKQGSTQVLDNRTSLIKDLRYAIDKFHCDQMKQECAQVLDNVLTSVNETSSLSYAIDKDHSDHERVKQASANMFHNGMSVVNSASNLSCANNEGRGDVDLVKQASTQVSDNGASIVNETSSSSYANDKGCCNNGLMKQASTQENKSVPFFKYVESTSQNAQITNHEITTKDLRIKRTGDIAVQSMKEMTDEHGEMNARNGPEVKSHQNVSSLKRRCENVEKNTINPLATNVQISNLNVQFLSLHSLIRQCEHLVTEFEKLIVSLKNDTAHDKKDSIHHPEHTFECSQFSHHCCCCVKIVHTCCCCRNRHNR